MSIKTLSSRTVYQNRWMAVREDAIERDDGSAGIYGVVHKPDFVLIIPIEGDKLYLVDQFRYAVGGRFAEFPQGSWEADSGATPEAIARGELQEETGLTAGTMQYLGHLFIAYGMSDQGFHIFRASGLTEGAAQLESEEQDLLVKSMSISDFEDGIRSGLIKDAATLAAWALHRLSPDNSPRAGL